jgi:hypothetical protein
MSLGCELEHELSVVVGHQFSDLMACSVAHFSQELLVMICNQSLQNKSQFTYRIRDAAPLRPSGAH